MRVGLGTYLTDDLYQGIRAKFRSRYKNYNHNSEIWHILHNYKQITEDTTKQIISCNWDMDSYRFWVTRAGASIPISSFKDRVVINVVTAILDKLVGKNIPDNYYKKKGKGRMKAIEDLRANLGQYKYVFKTDVKSYFASIDHDILMKKLKELVAYETIIHFVNQIITNYVEFNGRYWRNHQGIPFGISTSCLLGSLYLTDQDKHFLGKENFYYQRFVDDIIVLTKTKHQQDRAKKAIYRILKKHNLKTRYEKTFIGKTTDTIIYLGCKFQGNKLGASRESIDKMRQKYVRLSEQGASEKRLRTYVRRWEGSFRFRHQSSTTTKNPCPARGYSSSPRLPWNSRILEEPNAIPRMYYYNRDRLCSLNENLAKMRPEGNDRYDNRVKKGEGKKDDYEICGKEN